jgi:putative membrane protein
MFIKILIMILIGLLAGSITGLIPGLHINTVCFIIMAGSSFLLQHFSALEIAMLIISMAVTHTFIDSIPSIYLGAPSGETGALIVLPGHKMLLEGKGHSAVMLTALGSLFSLALSIAILPLLFFLFKALYPFVKEWIGFILLAASLFIIARGNRKLLSLAFFFLSGILGLSAFRALDDQALMPMLSGLFGISILLLSLRGESALPEQKIERILPIKKKEARKGVIGATLASSIAAFLPGFGNAQAAIMAQSVIGKLSTAGTLLLLGGINTANMAISIITLLAIGKARNGALVTVSKLIERLTPSLAIKIAGVALVAGGVAVILAKIYSERFSKILRRISYKKLIIGIISMIIVLVTFGSGWRGIILLITATCIGISASLLGIAKNNLMGCLILPVVCYFLGLA